MPVEQALKDANLKLTDINEVILVGGSTRIPAVQVCLFSLSLSSLSCFGSLCCMRGQRGLRLHLTSLQAQSRSTHTCRDSACCLVSRLDSHAGL